MASSAISDMAKTTAKFSAYGMSHGAGMTWRCNVTVTSSGSLLGQLPQRYKMSDSGGYRWGPPLPIPQFGLGNLIFAMQRS